jgi:hypothetical protein
MPYLRGLLLGQAPLKFGSLHVILLDSKEVLIEYDIERGEFLLDHNTEYSIVIGNFHKTLKAFVEIEIDGVRVGTFQLIPNTINRYERPVGEDRKFTFVDKDSQLGHKGRLDTKSVSDLGWSKLVIRQEIPSEDLPPDVCWFENDGCKTNDCETDGCVGGTVLGNKSNQRITPTPSLHTKEVCVFMFRMGLRPKANSLTDTAGRCTASRKAPSTSADSLATAGKASVLYEKKNIWISSVQGMSPPRKAPIKSADTFVESGNTSVAYVRNLWIS